MSESVIVIAAKPEDSKRQKIKVTLIGIDYTITAPKAGLSIATTRGYNSKDERLRALSVTSFNHWIEIAFGDKAEEIFDRLDDQEDALDLQHISELQEQVITMSAGNPSTSSQGSRASRRANGQTSRGTR